MTNEFPMYLYHELQSRYKEERLLLSLGFVVMLSVILIAYIIQEPEAFLSFAAQAYQNPTEVFSSVVRGVAQR